MRRWRFGPIAAAALASLLLALSLAGKIRHYAQLDPGRQTIAETRLDSFLVPRGWEKRGAVPLTVAGDYRTLIWQGPDCAEPVEIGAFSSDGEAAGLIAQRVTPGHRLFFVHDGEALPEPARFAFLRDKLTVILETIGIPGFRASPYLAVIEPAACHLEDALPWEKL